MAQKINTTHLLFLGAANTCLRFGKETKSVSLKTLLRYLRHMSKNMFRHKLTYSEIGNCCLQLIMCTTGRCFFQHVCVHRPEQDRYIEPTNTTSITQYEPQYLREKVYFSIAVMDETWDCLQYRYYKFSLVVENF